MGHRGWRADRPGISGTEMTGGRIARPIFQFPGGRRLHFVDPDGYELAIWSKR
jgi:predicted enzyme related to lactoylglutathione lyase